MARSADFIGADELAEAIQGHRDRVAMHGPRPIHRIISSLRVDADEFQAASKVVVEHRRPSEEDLGPFTAGFFDGFVIGVRAARSAAARAEGER